MHKPKIAILATTSQEDIGSGLLSTIILPDAIIPDYSAALPIELFKYNIAHIEFFST